MPEATSPTQPDRSGVNFRTGSVGPAWCWPPRRCSLLFFSSRSISSLAIQNPYVGILAYVVAPLFFLLGLALTLLGAILHKFEERRAELWKRPNLFHQIDLSRKRDRRILAVFAFGAVGFLFLTALGSYETYQYTESVDFCGKRCHVPMEPQFVAAQHTAHAQVACVDCHVGPGAAAYFKTKLNGVKQLYHTALGDFDRPIHMPRNPAGAGDLPGMPLAEPLRRHGRSHISTLPLG